MSNETKNSSVFGILCLVAAIVGWGTPRLLITFIYLAIFGFGIVGLIRDGTKSWSVVGLLIGCLLLYTHFNTVVAEEREQARSYVVVYEVLCRSCDVTYTNESGGTSQERNILDAFWKSQTFHGNDFVYISAQLDAGTTVTARILIDGKVVGSETSEGRYSIASVSGSVRSLSAGK